MRLFPPGIRKKISKKGGTRHERKLSDILDALSGRYFLHPCRARGGTLVVAFPGNSPLGRFSSRPFGNLRSSSSLLSQKKNLNAGAAVYTSRGSSLMEEPLDRRYCSYIFLPFPLKKGDLRRGSIPYRQGSGFLSGSLRGVCAEHLPKKSH